MTPTPEERAETDALLAAYAAVTDHAGWGSTYGKVEQAMNTASLRGQFAEAERIRVEMNRITRAIQPLLAAERKRNAAYLEHTTSAINFIMGNLPRKQEVA